MRKLITGQLQPGKTQFLGTTSIEDIRFDPRCRDEITKTLRGLQELYLHTASRTAIFTILEKMLPAEVSRDKGREGMSLWAIFVLGMVRLACNWDYDKLKNAYDYHIKIRQMAGVDLFLNGNTVSSLQCIHDNVSLFTSEIAAQINKVVVDFGHQQIFPNEKPLHTRCDSFVFLANVHFPTDFNLLLDCVRKCIALCSASAQSLKLPGWREHQSLFEKARSCYNTLSKMRHSNSKKEDVKEKRRQAIHAQVKVFLEQSERNFRKAEAYQQSLNEKIAGLDSFLDYGRLFIDQIIRRVFKEEKIPQEEKIYSVFEPYTEWVCKGKAGVRQELGVKICVVEDQFGFILTHHMMKQQQDKEIAVAMVQKCQALFPSLSSMSFDKGFHSKMNETGKNNRLKIEELGVTSYLPTKGRRNQEDRKRETDKDFIKARKQHPAVESAINALESHGLDRCPDKGEDNFMRYASMAVTASNLHRIGAIFMAKELEKINRKSA